MRALTLTALLVSFAAHAGGDVPPEKVAKIKVEQKAAVGAGEKKYGNKKPADMSASERKQFAKDKNDAELKVLDKNGVDSKTFSRAELTMSSEDRATAADAQKGMEKKAEDEAKAADEKKKAQGKDGAKKEIVIEKGGKGGPPPGAQGGAPADDAAEAAAMDREAGLGKGKGK